jgi:light-regulated signal transduction histidine kinase (bacteriophytochrome)
MQKLIADILAFSRVGRENLQKEEIDCNALLQNVLSEFDAVIATTNAQTTIEKLPIVTSSQTLLHVLFQNLIGNALKFQDGTRPPQIGVAAQKFDDRWQFSVHDNGIGIDPAFSDSVFTLFQRIHRREEYPGTGIGLSTCKKFVELYGGKIWFESTPGMGSRFYFTVPHVMKGSG